MPSGPTASSGTRSPVGGTRGLGSRASLERPRAFAALGGPGVLFAVAWLAFFTMLQWSVVRFRIPIVATLCVCTVGLALWQWRGWHVRLGRGPVALMLAGSALATLAVPLFSYLGPAGLAVATTLLVAGPLAAAALLWSPQRLWSGSGRRRWWGAAAAVAVLTYAAGAATAVVSSPRPRIDVWVTLQQAADGLLHGQNAYAMVWSGSPGIKDAFTYLPWTAVLLAPGRWLAGDVRWALAVWTLVAVAGIWALTRNGRPTPTSAGSTATSDGTFAKTSNPTSDWTFAAVTSLVLFAPGTLTQLDQAWTEPLLLAGLVWWAALVHRGRPWWAVLPLALACASKQHLALLLPVLLVWRGFGWRRTVSTGALTGLLIAPWFLAGPADFVHDTITLLLSFHPIRFANTLYLLALNTFGVTLPFYVTGLAVLGTLTAVCVTVWRRQPSLPALLRWLSLVLLVANLVNKQAFYNQFWLVGALVVVSLAVEPGPPPVSQAQTHNGSEASTERSSGGSSEASHEASSEAQPLSPATPAS